MTNNEAWIGLDDIDTEGVYELNGFMVVGWGGDLNF